MRQFLFVLATVLVCGCQSLPIGRASVASTDALARLDGVLAGQYDNHEQVRQVAVKVQAGNVIAVPHMREEWRALSRNHGGSLWLWRLQTLDSSNAADAVWLYLISSAKDGSGVVLTPYRAIDPNAANTAFADTQGKFKFVAEQWAELAPCALSGTWKGSQFSASANISACSALLPGLGKSAGLLPLQFALTSEVLHSVTFADQARGADAGIDARRVRWFDGWAAINGGGPKAKSGNQDWHVQKDLHLASEGGRLKLRWRDGSASGYSLALARTTYAQRNLSVLQLDVIDDATGQVLDYVWTDPHANAIGFNLGWLQVGLTSDKATAETRN
ncbi:MAG TPA: hypothetical protein VFN13_01850 [Rudaea sp.]|nr:hypothetical protein [Rudaea sp.]